MLFASTNLTPITETMIGLIPVIVVLGIVVMFLGVFGLLSRK